MISAGVVLLCSCKHCNIVKANASIQTVDTMETWVEINKVNRQLVYLRYLNYISCGPAHEMIFCFCNVFVTEKKSNTLIPHVRTIHKMDTYLL